MEALHTLNTGPNHRVVLRHDYAHEPHYGLDTWEETAAAIAHERAQLDAGVWCAYSLTTEERCTHCGVWEETDSLHGIVTDTLDPSDDAVRDLYRDHVAEQLPGGAS